MSTRVFLEHKGVFSALNIINGCGLQGRLSMFEASEER